MIKRWLQRVRVAVDSTAVARGAAATAYRGLRAADVHVHASPPFKRLSSYNTNWRRDALQNPWHSWQLFVVVKRRYSYHYM